MQHHNLVALTLCLYLAPAFSPSTYAGQTTNLTPCQGLEVKNVTLSGCNTSLCDDPAFIENLVSLTDLVSTRFQASLAKIAVKRLEKIGYFSSIQLSCRASAGKAELTIKVVPYRLIASVSFAGLRHVYESDLRKRLFIYPGLPFLPEDKKSKQLLSRQLDSFTSYLHRIGLQSAKVTAETRPIGRDMIQLVFRIDEGQVARVAKLEVDVKQEQSANSLYSCPKVSSLAIKRIADVSQGTIVSPALLRQVKRKIVAFLQQNGFVSPSVITNYNDRTKILKVSVKLQRCFAIQIFERDQEEPFERGYEDVTRDELLHVLPFRESGVFDKLEAERGLEELLAHYELSGYLFRKGRCHFLDFRNEDPDWPYPLVGKVTYYITKNQVAEIRSIDFVGVRHMDESMLLELMQTKVYDFFDIGGYLQPEQLFADLEALKQAYKRQGYYAMRYPRAFESPMRILKFKRKDSIILRYSVADKSFDVIKHDWENPVYIRIYIEEGPQSKIGRMQFEGIRQFSQKELFKGLNLAPGSPFSTFLVRQGVRRLIGMYSKQGYIPKIEVSCTGHQPEVPTDECKLEEVDSLIVDLTIRVVEGKPLKVGELFVIGNIKTKTSTILSDLPNTNEPFDRDKIEQGLRKLRNSGVFESVSVDYIGLHEQPPRTKIALVVHIQESMSKFIEISAGFQTMIREEFASGASRQNMARWAASALSTYIFSVGSTSSGAAGLHQMELPDLLLLLEIAYLDRNFLGKAKQLQIPAQYGLSTTDPMRYLALTPTYRDQRFLGTDAVLRLTPLIRYDRALSRLDIFEYGFESELLYTFTSHIVTSLQTRISRASWKQPEKTNWGTPEFQFKVTPELRFDWRNNPINPTYGSFVSGRLSYINALNEWGNRDNFIKYDIKTQIYFPLRKAGVLAFNLRIGSSWAHEGKILPENQRFFLGGTNGLRGFPTGAVPQYNKDGTLRMECSSPQHCSKIVGGSSIVNSTAELRFPVLSRYALWGAIFTDAGGVADKLKDFHRNSIRFTIGLGIRWLIGGYIPLRIDYGFLLGRRCYEQQYDETTGAWICILQDSPGALDFGLLYSF